MHEENGTVIIHVLGIARQDFPITLIGARVDIYKASRADDAKKRETPGETPSRPGQQKAMAVAEFLWSKATTMARATFADAHGWSEPVPRQ